MIYVVTDEQIKQFVTDRFEDECARCAFYHNAECNEKDCAEGFLRSNITPFNQEHFSEMSTEILCSLIDALQSEVKNREDNERKKHIERLRQQYKELSQEAYELGIDLF